VDLLGDGGPSASADAGDSVAGCATDAQSLQC
jgi:hypothetical protein